MNLSTSFLKQGTCGSTGDIYTCFRVGNSGASSTADLGGSGSGTNYNNSIAVRFDSLDLKRLRSAKLTISINLNSSDYANASQTITVAPCANFTNNTKGTALMDIYGGTAKGTLAGNTASISIDVKDVLNTAINNGSKCLYITANTANNRKRVSGISLTYEQAPLLKYNGNDVDTLIFNGNAVTGLVFNGTTIF